jgi:hypothetical protein
MRRFRLSFHLLVAASLVAVSVPLSAQTTHVLTASEPLVKPLSMTQRPQPFSYGSEAAKSAAPVEFLASDRMSGEDRALAAGAEGEIRKHASFHGMEFNPIQWSSRQIVCPALPHHLFLRFARNEGTGAVSLFSASIPRGGDGRVRVIPIRRRGYGLFSPAPINAQTVAAFNQIRDEEHLGQSYDWLGTGLCYAALAGADGPPDATPSLAPPAVLEIPVEGGAMIRFTDGSAPHPMEWTLRFNGKGKLLKATHASASMVKEKAERPVAVDERGKLLHSAAVDEKGK